MPRRARTDVETRPLAPVRPRTAAWPAHLIMLLRRVIGGRRIALLRLLSAGALAGRINGHGNAIDGLRAARSQLQKGAIANNPYFQ